MKKFDLAYDEEQEEPEEVVNVDSEEAEDVPILSSPASPPAVPAKWPKVHPFFAQMLVLVFESLECCQGKERKGVSFGEWLQRLEKPRNEIYVIGVTYAGQREENAKDSYLIAFNKIIAAVGYEHGDIIGVTMAEKLYAGLRGNERLNEITQRTKQKNTVKGEKPPNLPARRSSSLRRPSVIILPPAVVPAVGIMTGVALKNAQIDSIASMSPKKDRRKTGLAFWTGIFGRKNVNTSQVDYPEKFLKKKPIPMTPETNDLMKIFSDKMLSLTSSTRQGENYDFLKVISELSLSEKEVFDRINRIPLSDLKITGYIDGNEGNKIFYGELKRLGKQIVLKTYEYKESETYTEFFRELSILQNYSEKNRHIIRFFGIVFRKKACGVVMEVCFQLIFDDLILFCFSVLVFWQNEGLTASFFQTSDR